jgi:hypothetical protein
MTSTGGSRCGAGQRGQGTVEWIGTLTIVAALIAVVALAVPSIGQNLGQRAVCLVSHIFTNASCSASSKPPNELVCTTATQTDDANDQVSVLFVNVGNDHTLIKTTYSNGEVQYTLVGESEAEVQAKLFQAEGEVGDAGFDVQVTAAAGGMLQGSHTWTFPNAQAAAAFDQQVSSSGGWGAVLHDFAGPVGGWILNQVGIHGAPNPSGLDPKNLTYAYTAAGIEGHLNAGANFGLGPTADADLNAELEGAVGVRYITSDDPTDVDSDGNVQKGDIQFFINLGANADGAVGATLFGASGSGDADATAVVTVGPHGTLEQVQIDASGQYTGSAQGGAANSKTQGAGGDDGGSGDEGGSGEGGSGEGGSGEGGSGGEGSGGEVGTALNLTQNDGAGVGYQYDGTLNLTNDPTAETALLQLLSGDSGAGAQTLMQQMNTAGTQRVQPYTVSQSKSQAGLMLEIADIGGGVQAGTSTQSQSFSPGSVKTAGGTWEKVICEK